VSDDPPNGCSAAGRPSSRWDHDAVDDDPLEIDNVTLSGERLLGLELDRAQLVDVTIDGCDLSGIVMSAYAVRRAKVMQTRIRDCVWAGGIMQDVTFEGCPSEQLSLRFSTLQRVAFTGCTLVGADFYGVTFDRVTFERCDLSGAHFDSATVKALTFTACTLLGVTGALSLRGAVVDLDDLAGLAPSLAREAGLRFSVDD
jgi:uncharacterized protein YjbI with pentapeptide repeats